jgi:TRAP-type C4-dicarboxylate transport system permease small subunit
MAEEDARAPDATHPSNPGGQPPTETEGLGFETNPEILPRREPWRRMVHAIGVIEQAIGALLLFTILVLVVSLVAQRYLPGANFPWTGEVARLCMVWATFVMAGYLAAHDRHIAIHVVDFVLRPQALAVTKMLVNVIVLATCLGLLYATYQLIEADIGQVTAAGEIPLRFVNAVPIVGFALTALRSALAIAVVDIPAVAGRAEAPA